MNDFFAEVIESSLDGWEAQSWKWNKYPSFGSTVVIENNQSKLFGIVHKIQTGAIDSNRQAYAYQKTEKELLQEQPQIFEFLKTTFSCLTLGYQEKNLTYHMLFPYPPKIHSFVREANKIEIISFFQNSKYLQILFGHINKISNFDELLLALLKNLKESNSFDENKFDDFIEKFSLLTCNDYRRLRLFLQRIDFLMD